MNKEIENCLLVLMEECAEVQKVCSKIIRFGFESYNPRDPDKKTNLVLLAEEYGDITGTIDKFDELMWLLEENIPDERQEWWNIMAEKRYNKPAKIDKYYKEN